MSDATEIISNYFEGESLNRLQVVEVVFVTTVLIDIVVA